MDIYTYTIYIYTLFKLTSTHIYILPVQYASENRHIETVYLYMYVNI